MPDFDDRPVQPVYTSAGRRVDQRQVWVALADADVRGRLLVALSQLASSCISCGLYWEAHTVCDMIDVEVSELLADPAFAERNAALIGQLRDEQQRVDEHWDERQKSFVSYEKADEAGPRPEHLNVAGGEQLDGDQVRMRTQIAGMWAQVEGSEVGRYAASAADAALAALDAGRLETAVILMQTAEAEIVRWRQSDWFEEVVEADDIRVCEEQERAIREQWRLGPPLPELDRRTVEQLRETRDRDQQDGFPVTMIAGEQFAAVDLGWLLSLWGSQQTGELPVRPDQRM